jgi:hypothetical protein
MHDGCVVAHTLPGELIDDQRRTHREIRTAEVQSRVSAEEQSDHPELVQA